MNDMLTKGKLPTYNSSHRSFTAAKNTNNNNNSTRFIIYVALASLTLFTWSQLDSMKKLQHHSDNEDSLLQQNTTEHLFTTTEMDPATWSIQVKENEPLLTQVSLFPPSVFSKDNDRGMPPVTAIINRIDHSDLGIIHSVQHLSKYPFIKEIFIYNQVLSRPLKAEQIYLNSSTTRTDLVIEIKNQQAPLGKFTACAMATYDKCWFQDDLWLNTYLDTLYTHSARYPDHFVVNTRPSNYVDYKKWRFANVDIGLHTGYGDMRYGAFISRQKVQKFLSQTSNQDVTSKLKQYPTVAADIYFSIWLNQYPYLITNPLLSNGRDRFKHVDAVNNRALVEYYMHDALSLLEASLQTSNSVLTEEDDYFEKTELMPVEEKERDIRASCSNDRCLFITNMDIMPPPFTDFNSTVINNMTEFDTLYSSSNIPFPSSYVHQAYHKAVDQNTETCWNSVRAPKMYDYFGLYMTGDIAAKRVILYTPNNFNTKRQPLNEIFKVTIQYRIFGSWEDCRIKSTPSTAQLNYRIGFDFECPQGKREPFKSIRITFLQDMDQPFELCGIGLDNFVL